MYTCPHDANHPCQPQHLACMCVHTNLYLHVHVHICTQPHTHTLTLIYPSIHMRAYTHSSIHPSTCVHTHTHLSIHPHACSSIHPSTCVHTHTHLSIHPHACVYLERGQVRVEDGGDERNDGDGHDKEIKDVVPGGQKVGKVVARLGEEVQHLYDAWKHISQL